MEEHADPMTEAMYYVLLSLFQPGHGYAMMQRIRELSGGRLAVGPGTLYGVLTRMRQAGWIQPDGDGGRRKTYRITGLGRRELLREYRRLEEMVKDGAFLKGEDGIA